MDSNEQLEQLLIESLRDIVPTSGAERGRVQVGPFLILEHTWDGLKLGIAKRIERELKRGRQQETGGKRKRKKYKSFLDILHEMPVDGLSWEGKTLRVPKQSVQEHFRTHHHKPFFSFASILRDHGVAVAKAEESFLLTEAEGGEVLERWVGDPQSSSL